MLEVHDTARVNTVNPKSTHNPSSPHKHGDPNHPSHGNAPNTPCSPKPSRHSILKSSRMVGSKYGLGAKLYSSHVGGLAHYAEP